MTEGEKNDDPVMEDKGKLFRIPSSEIIYSRTNEMGEIIDLNDAFVRASGYTADFLMGKNHRLLRHPDMPWQVYKDIYVTLNNGKQWFGAVKNKRANGDHYWVYASISQTLENSDAKEYESVRFPIVEIAEIEKLEKAYAEIKSGEREYVPSTQWRGSTDTDIEKNMVTRDRYNLRSYAALILVIAMIASMLFYPAEDKYYILGLAIVGFISLINRKIALLTDDSPIYDTVVNITKGKLRDNITGMGKWTDPLCKLRSKFASYLAFKKESLVKKEVLRIILSKMRTYVLVTGPDLVIMNHSYSCHELLENAETAQVNPLSKLAGTDLSVLLSDILGTLDGSSKSIAEGSLIINDVSYNISIDIIEVGLVKKGYVILLNRTEQRHSRRASDIT